MIAVTASFLCSALLGLRLTLIGFLPVMLAISVAVFAYQDALTGALTLVMTQLGYVGGVLMRAFLPTRSARPALRRATAR
jgi:hypothetical protein